MDGDRFESSRAAMARRQARDEEIVRCTQALRERPKDAELYYRRGNAHRQNGELMAAVCDFNRAVEMNPAYAEAYFYKAITCAALGYRLEEARAYRLFLQYAGRQASSFAVRIKRRLLQIEPRQIHGRVAAL